MAAESMMTVILGGAGIRAFGGIDGAACDSASWQALASSYNLIHLLEPQILQQEVAATNLGPNIYTAARSGSNGRLFMALNSMEAPQTVSVNLAPYIGASTGFMTRYHIAGSQVFTESVPIASQDTITLAPNETVIWLFRNNTNVLPTVEIVWPPANAQVEPQPTCR